MEKFYKGLYKSVRPTLKHLVGAPAVDENGFVSPDVCPVFGSGCG